MGKSLKNISTLEYNIFTLTPIIIAFYKNVSVRKFNFLLAYFVLPILLHEPSWKILKNANIKSRLLKITDNEDIMAGFHDRFKFYRDITNQCLQYAIETELLLLDQATMTIRVNNQTLRRLPYNRKFSTAYQIAPKLAGLFKQDVRTIYIYFGIKQL